MSNAITVQKYLRNSSTQARISDLLKAKAGPFTTSLMSAINANEKLAKCKPETVLNAAITAASLDLPINNNLGFAYIIPYGNEAQFQMGYKGFIQLAQRSNQYKTIAATEVYEGQLVDEDPLRGNSYDWKAKTSDKVVGYVSMLILINGFEKSLYMTAEEMEAHAKKYSAAYKGNYQTMWKDDFNAMALKTVLKLLISKFGPMTTELQKAVVSDQAVITDDEPVYIDNTEDVGADPVKKQAIIEAHTTSGKQTDDNDSSS